MRPAAYIAIVLTIVLLGGAYSIRRRGVFQCPAEYRSGWYLSYCSATNYGDYDHGAFWFGLEPQAIASARSADVLFIGNSRTQFGLSSDTTLGWFTSRHASYFLMGLPYWENYTFTMPLVRKLDLRPAVDVINIDEFFESRESEPGGAVMHDGSAQQHYEEKRSWQVVHRLVCQHAPRACGHSSAIFRSKQTGEWIATGGRFAGERVSYTENVDEQEVRNSVATASRLLPGLNVRPDCVILTMVPHVDTPLGTARATAQALRLDFVAPALAGLMTFDGSHLDRPSAERWSAAFMEAAGPRISECVSQSQGRHGRAGESDAVAHVSNARAVNP